MGAVGDPPFLRGRAGVAQGVTVGAARLANYLSPLDRTVYATALEFGWDPLVIADELVHLNKKIDPTTGAIRGGGYGEVGGGRGGGDRDRVQPADVVASIARIRLAVGKVIDGARADVRVRPTRQRPPGLVMLGTELPLASSSYAAQEPTEGAAMADTENDDVVVRARATAARAAEVIAAVPLPFADRIRGEVNREAARVLADLERLKFDAHQVAHVMRALKIPVPVLIAAVADADMTEVAPRVAPARERRAEDGSEFSARFPYADERKPEPDVQPVKEGEEFTTLAPAPEEPPAPDPEQDQPPAAYGKRAEMIIRARERKERIIECVRRGVPSLGKIGKELDIPEGSVHRLVGTLIADGQLTRDASGALVIPGESPLPASPAEPPVTSPAPRGAAQAAASRKKIMDHLATFGAEGTSLRGVFEPLGMSQPNVSKHLREMISDGVVLKRGNLQSARYVLVEADSRVPAPDPSPADRVESAVSADRLAVIQRLAVAKKGSGPFSPSVLVAESGLPEGVVRGALVILIQKEIVEYVGLDDLELYEYRKPTDPGAAARLDAQSRTNGSGSDGAGAAPVPGTGGGLRASSKEVNTFLVEARRLGATVKKNGEDHFVITNPKNNRHFVIYATPSTPSTDKNRKKLRAIGLG